MKMRMFVAVVIVVILCVMVVRPVGCTPREKSCREQSAAYLTQLNALIVRSAAAETAGGEAIGTATEKNDILVVISELEDIKNGMRGLNPPSCAHNLQVKSIAMIDATMDAFWLIAAEKSNAEIAAAIEVMKQANDEWRAAYSEVKGQ